MAAEGRIRYGVFLRPDPRTCAAVTTITNQIRAQYGLVSASRFPPHATLAGSLPLAGEPKAALDGLLQTLDAVLEDVPCFPVANAGIAWLGPGLVYDIHRLPGDDDSDGPGRPNEALVELAAAVQAAVRPLLGPVDAGELGVDLHERQEWHGHLSLVSHELVERGELRPEIEEYAVGLGVAVPPRFTAEVVSLYRFVHRTWAGPWWTDFRWDHVRSWRLEPLR